MLPMQEFGTVVETDGKYAIVEVRRKSACEGCHKGAEGCDACSLFIADAKHRVSAENRVGALAGDRVMLEAASGRILCYAFLVFILPLLIAGTVYAISSLLTTEGYAVLFAALAMFCAYFVIGKTSTRLEKKKRSVSISKILIPKENQTESEES